MEKNIKKKWTIIMQVSAESNLFDEMLTVMQELFEIKDGKKQNFDGVNFIVVFDGIKAKKFSKEFACPSVYEVKPNTSFFLEYPINKKQINENLTDVRTLTSVYNQIITDFPAEQFGFISKGHGGAGTGDISSGTFFSKILKVPDEILKKEEEVEKFVEKTIKGWAYEGVYNIRGYLPCLTNEKYVMVIVSKKNAKSLTYRKMSDVLENVFKQQKLEFIFLDCCWGMQIETAYTFKNRCKYFIASADEMPAAGIGYTDFLKKIVSRPQIIGREIANIILSVYFTNKYDDYDSDNEEFWHMGVSLTNLKTNAMDEFIEKFNLFCKYANSEMDNLALMILKARACCKDYTYVVPTEYAVYNIDMIWFFENLLYFNNQLCINDKVLTNMLLELIYILTIKLRYGYLGNNYQDVELGNQELGGKGITITFPENRTFYRTSMYVDKKSIRPQFVDNTEWNTLLLAFYDCTEKIERDPGLFINYYTNKFADGNKILLSLFDIEDITAEDSHNKIINLFTEQPDTSTKGKWGKFVPLNL